MCGVGNLTRATYATQRIVCYSENFAKVEIKKRDTRVALRGYPRGVSSHHVFYRAFGDAYCRREDVRHATLLFARRV